MENHEVDTLSLSSTSSSLARRKAMAKLAMERSRMAFQKEMAEAEAKIKLAEVQERANREIRQIEHERRLAELRALESEAVAAAELRAINEAIDKEEDERVHLVIPKQIVQQRTSEWVEDTRSNVFQKSSLPPLGEDVPRPSPSMPYLSPVSPNLQPLHPPDDTHVTTSPPVFMPVHQVPAQTACSTFQQISGSKHDPPDVYKHTPLENPQTSTLSPVAHEFTPSVLQPNITERLVTSLARQSLPKCHPDVFAGDATTFYPWRNAFRAMIREAAIDPEQEINYLLEFTSGRPKNLIASHRKRQHLDPAKALDDAWRALEERFGNVSVISNSFLERLKTTAKFSDSQHRKLQDFADLCEDVLSQQIILPALNCLDYSATMNTIISACPSSLQTKWNKIVVGFARKNCGEYPPFRRFCEMVTEQATLKNHPSVTWYRPDDKQVKSRVLKTETSELSTSCPIHESSKHDLTQCHVFKKKSLRDKNAVIRKAGLCYKCLVGRHKAENCTAEIVCKECDSKLHLTVMHKNGEEGKTSGATTNKNGEEGKTSDVTTKCTMVCSGKSSPSCSKIILAEVYSAESPENRKRVYIIHDDQSNSSLISPELLDDLEIEGEEQGYVLTTCSGTKTCLGRRTDKIVVRSLTGKEARLPALLECEHIPRDKSEVPTPDLVRHHPHLKGLTDEIPKLDQDVKVQILLGRDAPEMLKVRSFKNGPPGSPWAQRLFLGWTVLGQMCLDGVGGALHVSTLSTSSHEVGFCPNQYNVDEVPDLFATTDKDCEPGLSVEDRRFLDIMERGIHETEQGHWEMPLPFKDDSRSLPNNRPSALSRFRNLQASFKRKPKLEAHYREFMGKLIDNGDASVVEDEDIETPPGGVWYLPHFAVYHPKKPDQVIVVFDASAEYKGTSLNKNLLAGPDQMNSLLDILLRFRQRPVAIMCDVQQMFYCFKVDKSDRNFLRFLWFDNNDPKESMREYQMNVHVFGNCSSPAVATFGLRKTADLGLNTFGSEARTFIHKSFYVDDGLTSVDTPEQAVDLIKRSQALLAQRNIRLHKVSSNDMTVVSALPEEDRANDIRSLNLHQDVLPIQRSLGVYWNLKEDVFTFQVSLPGKPFSRRGVLAIVNSVYDPLGIAGPVVIEGRKILQTIIQDARDKKNPVGWDEPLPETLHQEWQSWRNGLQDLETVKLDRCYCPKDFVPIVTELHTFSDASFSAIAAVCFLRFIDDKDEVHVTFCHGKTKVTPLKTTTMPRLELCAAVLGTQVTHKVKTALELQIDRTFFYTDSKVVLGYIQNEARRFYVYVANRVQQIRTVSHPSQWRYVNTTTNPADIGTRGTTPSLLLDSSWLQGPDFLRLPEVTVPSNPPTDELMLDDPEVRKDVTTLASSTYKAVGLAEAFGDVQPVVGNVPASTPEADRVEEERIDDTNQRCLESNRFDRFSSWTRLIRAVARLIDLVRVHKGEKDLRSKVDSKEKAVITVIKAVQRESFGDTIARLQQHQESHAKGRSTLSDLDPFIDEEGLVRVGGRLRRSRLIYAEKHPIVLPKGHHITRLVIQHYHELVHHQGRSITHGAVRQAGFWIVGGHSQVSSVLHSCVTCRRLRHKLSTQKMGDLPQERLEPTPPFTHVGCDVFGPWEVLTRKTRGGSASSKRWGLVFTCLASRAIHIELLESMDTDSFLCALRRFIAIRGDVKQIVCDQGTNFKGGESELKKAGFDYITWKFNPPHASHFGGVWERMIGTIRRVLDGMLIGLGKHQLTHELLSTLLAEVTSIVNARPISAIPSDIDEPQPLSPSMLLTLKRRPITQAQGNFVPEDLRVYGRRRWRRVQYLADQFWLRWRREYLHDQQSRRKWEHPRRNVSIDDVVLIREKEVTRNEWPLGRVVEVFGSEDGLVRKVRVETVRGGNRKSFDRPVQELVVLLESEKQ